MLCGGAVGMHGFSPIRFRQYELASLNGKSFPTFYFAVSFALSPEALTE